MLQVHSGNACDFASALCKYNLRKDDDFYVVSRARLWRVCLKSVFSVVFMAGDNVYVLFCKKNYSSLLSPLRKLNVK